MNEFNKQAIAKRQGRDAAKLWLGSAAIADKVVLAGFDFRYGVDTLDDLIEEGIEVPSSCDPDFSWGFFKKVKGQVYHKVHLGGGTTSTKGVQK